MQEAAGFQSYKIEKEKLQDENAAEKAENEALRAENKELREAFRLEAGVLQRDYTRPLQIEKGKIQAERREERTQLIGALRELNCAEKRIEELLGSVALLRHKESATRSAVEKINAEAHERICKALRPGPSRQAVLDLAWMTTKLMAMLLYIVTEK